MMQKTKQSETANTLNVSVWRGNDQQGGYCSYLVPTEESKTILDVVTWIGHYLEPKLSYRFACRVGMCGSCAMMVNGKPRWTCRTQVKKVIENNSITIAPLRNLPVIKDLVCDMSDFFVKWRKAKGVFHPTTSRNDPMTAITVDDPKRKAASEAIECINCAVCYAACDVIKLNSDYLGPAALSRAWTLLNDVRDGAQTSRLKAVSENNQGCQNCHSQQSCSNYCPNELNPTASIAGLKRAAIRAYFTRGL